MPKPSLRTHQAIVTVRHYLSVEALRSLIETALTNALDEDQARVERIVIKPLTKKK